jgi:hypothetical protein
MILDRPVAGYWDGGAKHTFNFAIDGLPKRDTLGAFIRLGSPSANHWFHVSVGKTPRATLGHARRHLAAQAKRAGVPCRFTYMMVNNDSISPSGRMMLLTAELVQKALGLAINLPEL